MYEEKNPNKIILGFDDVAIGRFDHLGFCLGGGDSRHTRRS